MAGNIEENSKKTLERLIDAIRANAEISLGASQIAQENDATEDIELILQEGIANAARVVASGQTVYMECDPSYPTLVRQSPLPSREFGVASPDCLYQSAILHGDYTYIISGSRGSAAIFDIDIYSGDPSNIDDYSNVTSLLNKNIRIPAGEQLEVTLSKTPQSGHWLELPDGQASLFVRQYFSDWDSEEPGQLMIERKDARYPAPPVDESLWQVRIEKMCSWMVHSMRVMQQMVTVSLDSDSENIPRIDGPAGGFQQAAYYWGHCLCAPDQAVIIEFTPPKSEYWGIHLWNLQGAGLGSHLRMASLNDSQVSIDSDGKCRIVVSHTDPSVANWLDPVGRKLVLAVFRFLYPDSSPGEISKKTVPLVKLSDHLPADTKTISPEQRSSILRNRLASFHRRGMID